jgi:hypothetical protein
VRTEKAALAAVTTNAAAANVAQCELITRIMMMTINNNGFYCCCCWRGRHAEKWKGQQRMLPIFAELMNM